MTCKLCGACCKAPIIAESMEHIHKILWNYYKSYDFLRLDIGEYDTDYKFIAKYWRPIPMEEAIKINPVLKEWEKKGYLKKKYAYLCTMFKDGKCAAHDLRPKVCSRFPFYGKPKKLNTNYTHECGYMEALKEDFKKLNPYFKGINIPAGLLEKVVDCKGF
jgi:Fe-S-cluster containining protein